MRDAIRVNAGLVAVLVASLFAVSCAEREEADEETVVEEVTEGEEGEEVTEGGDAEPADEEVGEVEIGDAAPGTPEISAVAEGADCLRGLICLWEGFEKRGAGQGLAQVSQGCIRLRRVGLNNKVSSWVNRSPFNYRVFANADCSGRKFTARSGKRVLHMKEWNDKASSMCLVGLCP